MEIKSTILMSLFWKENPSYLNDSLSSIFNQTKKADEVVIVVEGKLPIELDNVLSKWEEQFGKGVLKIIDAQDAKGLPACLNKGLFAAKGEYIIRFDTDDICLPDRIEKQLVFFEINRDVVLLSAPIEEWDNEMKHKLGVRNVPFEHDEISRLAKWRSPFNHPAAAYRRDVAVQLGGYPIVDACEDYAFFSHFLQSGYKTANLRDVIVKARTGSNFVNRRKGKRFLKGELASLSYIHKIGFHSKPVYFFHVISRMVLRNMPSKALLLFYKKFLRK